VSGAQEARAIWFTAPGRVETQSEVVPAPGPGEVRVRAIRSAISHGTESKVLQGRINPALPLDLPTLRGSYGFPIKYGYASVGRVVDVGADVDLVPGDLIFALHPHQTRFVVPERLVVRLGHDVDPDVAVFLANLETAVTVTQDAQPRLGERVVIFGQGVVGLLILQLLRRTGVGKLIVVDPLRARRALAEHLGADLALTPTDDLAGQIHDFTDGVGADVVVESSGYPGALNQAIDAVAFGGSVVVSSWYGREPVALDLGGAFHRRRIHLISSQVSSIDPVLQPRWTPARRLALARDLLSSLTLGPLITQRIPFSCAAEAYTLIAQRPGETIQVVLTYPDEENGV